MPLRRAATSAPGSAWYRSRCRPETAPSWAGISRRGNRYLRKLFVQAAWVVLAKITPEGWERSGSSHGSRRQSNACTAMCWRSRSLTTRPYRLGSPPQGSRFRVRQNQCAPNCLIVAPCSGLSRRGLQTPAQVAPLSRRLALTALALGAPLHAQAGTKERLPAEQRNRSKQGGYRDVA